MKIAHLDLKKIKSTAEMYRDDVLTAHDIHDEVTLLRISYSVDIIHMNSDTLTAHDI